MRWFILAGGLGSRLFPFSAVFPKCLIDVAGKPCARRIVERLMGQGFSDIVLCVNSPSENMFRHEFRDLPTIRFSVSKEPQGTISELLNARNLMGSETFGLQYGDDLTEVDCRALLEFHRSRKAAVTMAVTTMYRLPIGVVEVDGDGRVSSFSEKPYLGTPSWTATALFEPEALRFFRAGEDMSLHALPRMIAEGMRVFAYRVDCPWFDVGDISAWARADQHYRDTKGAR